MMDAAIDELLAAGWAKDEIAPLLIEIKDRLRRNPLSFGEPIFTIRPIKLTVCVGFVRPLSVQIGIQEELRIVFIRNVTLMTTDKD